MTSSSPQLPSRYRSPAFVAEGAFGRVYRATMADGADVAVKVLGPQWLADADAVWGFTAEARRLQALRHPALPALVEQGLSEAGVPFYAMAFLPGAPPVPGTALAPADARAVLGAIAAALGHLHGHGLVHGDVKADNVLVGEAGTYLLDVGLARAAGERRTAVSGTLEYAAPEVLRLADVAPEADWYAFGVLAYVLLTGHPPFAADGRGPGELVRRQLTALPPALPDQVRAADPALADAVTALLHKDAAARRRALPAALAAIGADADTLADVRGGLAAAAWQPRPEVQAAWAALAAPDATVVLIGPEGAGKRGALDALRLEATLAGDLWVGATCAGAGGAPGGVARSLLRQALAHAGREADGPIAAWLAGRVPPAWLDLEPRARRLALHGALAAAWRDAVGAIAAGAETTIHGAGGGLVVGLDGFEALDPGDRELVDALVAAGGARWCLTTTPDATPPAATAVVLAPWTDDEVAALTASRLGAEPPRTLLDALAAVDARRPGLVVALLDHWHASGALAAADAGWAFAPDAGGGDADPWAHLWRAKIARLGEAEAHLAGVLAAFADAGAVPAWALARALDLPDAALQATLDALTLGGVVLAGPQGLTLAAMPAAAHPASPFPPAEQGALATRLARLLLGSVPDEGDGVPLATLRQAAAFAVRGADDDLAITLALAAARRALEHLAVEDAAALLARARSRFGERVPAAQRIAFHLAAAEAARLLDQKDVAADDLARALALAEAAGDDVACVTALTGLAKGRQLAGDYAGARTLAERALALGEQAGAPALAARAAMIVARVQIFDGALGAARASCARAAALAVEGGATVVRSHALNLQGVLMIQDDPRTREAALGLIREAIALAEGAGDTLGVATALENLGNAFLAVGELRDAEDAFARGAAICRTHRVAAEGLSADMNLALVRAELGEAADAHTLAADVAARAGRLGRAFVRGIALAVQGQAAGRQARFPEAFALLDEALAGVLAIKNRFAEEYVRLYRLEALLAAGALKAARAEALAAAEVVAVTELAEGRSRLALLQGELALAEGDQAGAVAHLTPLLDLGHLGFAHGAHLLLAQALGGDAGRAHAAAALALAEGWRAPWHMASARWVLARLAADPDEAVAEAREALAPGPHALARAGAACVVIAHGAGDASAYAAVDTFLALIADVPEDSRDRVLGRHGLPDAATLAALAAEGRRTTPASDLAGPFVGWLAAVLEAADERTINETVLEATRALVHADRGYLIEYDRGRLVQVVTSALDYAEAQADGFSSSIVEEVLLTGEPLCLLDASADARWSASASVHALGLRTVVAIPYATARQLLGVVYVDRQALEPVLGPAELQLLDVLARTGAERVAALRRENELLGELAFEREVSAAALGLARASGPGERREVVLQAALRLTGAERAFWLARPAADAAWRSLAACDAAGDRLAYDPRHVSHSVLTRTLDEREAVCLVESEEAEGWTPGMSVLALGLRMVWCVPVGADRDEVLYVDTRRLTAVDPHRMSDRLTALLARVGS